MARPLRLDYPDTFYHILSRGNERRDIFHDAKDYRRFLDLIGRMVERFKLEIHAYVLMKNHYHLLVRTQQANLSRAIQWLGVSYSVWFNRRHQRSGHLFQGRFKSFLIENDRYFSAMCLYIHGNPLRAGVVEKLADYPWSSFPLYSASRGKIAWLTMDLLLGVYGNSRQRFATEQRMFLEHGTDLLKDLHHGLYLGSADFGEECLRKANKERHREKPQYISLLRERDIRGVAAEILERLGGKDPSLLLSMGRIHSPLRDAAIFILYQLGAYRNIEIGSVFGMGYTAVTEAAKRGRLFLDSHKVLAKLTKQFLIDN